MPKLDTKIQRLVPLRPPIAILGVPFDNVTTADAVAAIERMVASRRPHYLVTANVDFLTQAQGDGELRRILTNAHLVLCDGAPVVWASRLLGNRLPERVAGADLVPKLLAVAAQKKYRVFFLGATPESAEQAVARLRSQHPSLVIAGHYSPPFKSLLEMDHEDIKRRIREARPDMLFVAFGCPKAEKWIAMHYRELGVPMSAGVGATIDFLAGRVKRAPRWIQQAGMEWMFRLAQEPRRLWRRYARDFWVFGWRIFAQWAALSRGTADGLAKAIEHAGRRCILDLSGIHLIDSSGIGLLQVLQKKLQAEGRQLVLAAPSRGVQRALAALRLENDFVIAPALPAVQPLPASDGPVWQAEGAVP
jgi:N-acetylglucosaminyldiphosphoundecaprenol N-acetyl-beta-D-mannosaminyltransferase